MLKTLHLLTGHGPPHDALRLCHLGRLVGGLSLSLRATPDEVVGPITHAMGGKARALRVLDVRSGPPMELEICAGERSEKWEVADVPALIHNLNNLYRDSASTKAVAVLGAWEDMLQVWCIDHALLPTLLRHRVLDEAFNASTLWALAKA